MKTNNKSRGPLTFRRVDIEVNSDCNLKCSYCPVSIIPPYHIKNMSEELFNRILDELESINYSDVIDFQFYNEPLLREDLELLISQVSKRLPQSIRVLFTNATLLTRERYEKLKEAGIQHWVITNHTKMDIKGIPEKILYIDGPEHKIENRGGILYKLSKPLNLPCFDPQSALIITVDGDVLLCCNDACRTQVMGNILHQPIEEIWYSNKFVEIRNMLANGDRANATEICRYCDNIVSSKPDGAYERAKELRNGEPALKYL